ncbi:MAG: hypothetical protein ACREP9_01285 [Candidatus Dormibacteraceae bacterium]
MKSNTGSSRSSTWTRLESLPDDVVASLEVRDAWRRQISAATDGLEFIVSDLARWRPGSTVRVAFLDGDASLHADVEQATQQITDACNLRLDFGRDQQTGEYRRWSEADRAYAAEIRVSFDLDGYWSLVGTDSTDRTVGAATRGVGGRPGQRSLNLGGLACNRPANWRGTVRHEFLHALAFHHAHQNLRGPCENEFRWEDDPGYTPTCNVDGVFVPDRVGRCPGIYTYLAGTPNYWPRRLVDHNLRMMDTADTIAGPFDREPIMLYAFEPFFYKNMPSKCAPTGNGIDLSDGDRRALRLLYPGTAAEVSAFATQAGQMLNRLGAGLELSVAEDGLVSTYRARMIELLTVLVSGDD